MIKDGYNKNVLNQVCQKILEIPRRIERLINHPEKACKE